MMPVEPGRACIVNAQASAPAMVEMLEDDVHRPQECYDRDPD
jgi:hypothetical protein